MYRSASKDYMNNLKDTVLEATKGQEKYDRKYALKYMQTHVKLDDLHRMGVKHFPRRSIVFGSGSLRPKIVVLTRQPIDETNKQKLDRAWEKLNLSYRDVYYAHLKFVATKKKQDKRKEMVGKLLEILAPQVVLVFDDVDVEADVSMVDTQLPVSVVSNPKAKEETKLLTRKLKEIRKQIGK